MIKTLHYKDEKSDKFWHVETAGCEMMTNWGKSGTSGRYEIKEFTDEAACEKQAEKLAASKMKKGYKEITDFNMDAHFYFDTEEFGLHPLTSHPVFRKYFADEFYYDCCDEETPFGNDNGNDTLSTLQETFRKRPQLHFADFPQYMVRDIWDMTYLPPDSTQTVEELKVQAAEKIDTLPGHQVILLNDQVILAAALGQIKITGKIDNRLLDLAFQSLNRMEKLYRIVWNYDEKELPCPIKTMRQDFNQLKNEIMENK